HKLSSLRPGTRPRHCRKSGATNRSPGCAVEFIWLWRGERFDRAPGADSMSLHLAGLGWVTPLGSQVEEVWEKLLAGSEAAPTTVNSSLGEGSNPYRVCTVPTEAIADAARYPRLRRSSVISRFAVVAGLRALCDAGLELDEAGAARTALVFAISNGGVIYTKR